MPVALAQSSSETARNYLYAAEFAYENKDYPGALTALNKVESLMGKSGARVAALRVKVYTDQQQWPEAKQALNNFYSFSPKQAYARKMSVYLLKIDAGIAANKATLTREREQAEAARITEQNRQQVLRLAEFEKERLAALEIIEAERRRASEKEASVQQKKDKRAKALARLKFFYDQNEIAPQLWSHVIKQDETELLLSVVATEDNSFVVAGLTGLNDNDMVIRKFNNKNKNSWVRNTKQDGSDQAKKIIVTDDGGYIAIGNGRLKSSNDSNFMAIKVTAAGKIKWSKQYSHKTDEAWGTGITRAKDGGYLITGRSYDTVNKRFNLMIVKINKKGKRKWQKSYQFKHSIIPSGVATTSDGGFLVIGQMQEPGAKTWGVWSSKISRKGAMLWQKSLVAPPDSWFKEIVKLPDGNFLMVGNKNIPEQNMSNGWLVKIDGDGTPIWDKTYKQFGNSVFASAAITQNNDIVIAGGSLEAGKNVDGLILKTNVSGTVIWSRFVGNDDRNALGSVAILDNQDIVAVGFHRNSGDKISSWALKLGAPVSTQPSPKGTSTMGVNIIAMSAKLVMKYAFDKNYEGVFIKRVTQNSPAQKAGLQPGDVITEISGTRVFNPDELNAQKQALFDQGEQDFALNIIRDSVPMSVLVAFAR